MPRRARASHVESSTTRCSAMVEAHRSEGGPRVPGRFGARCGAAGARDAWGRGGLRGSSCGTVGAGARAAGSGGWHVLLVRRPDRPAPEGGETPGRSAGSGCCPGLPPRHPPTWPLPRTTSPAAPSTAYTGGTVRVRERRLAVASAPAVCGRPGTPGRLPAYLRGDTLTTGIDRTVYPGLPIRPYRGQRWDGWSWTPERGELPPAVESGLNSPLPYRISRSWSRPPVPPSQEGGSASSVGLT